MPIAQDAQGPGQSSGPVEMFQSLPYVTKWWFGATLVLTLSANTGILNPGYLKWNWDAMVNEFQIWRLATPFIYAGIFGRDMFVFFLLVSQVMFSYRYENGGPFNTGAGGGTADYVWMLLFGAIIMIITKPITNLYWPIGTVHTAHMVYYVVYIWSKKFPTASMSFWGMPVQGWMMPFVLWGFAFLTKAPRNHMPFAYAVGHLYYFLVDVVPKVYGKDYLMTPQFLIDQFGIGEYREVAAPRNDGNRGTTASLRPHQWGSGGQTLGGSGPTGGSYARPRPTAPMGSERSTGSTNSSSGSVRNRRMGGGHNWGGGQALGSS